MNRIVGDIIIFCKLMKWSKNRAATRCADVVRQKEYEYAPRFVQEPIQYRPKYCPVLLTQMVQVK